MISIITPVKLHGKIHQATVLSVLQQSLDKFEWIVVVDGLEGWPFYDFEEKDLDKRIRVVFNESTSSGAGPSRNIGLQCAKGNYVTFIDADDEWKTNFLFESKNFIDTKKINSCFSGYERKVCKNNSYLSPFRVKSKYRTARDILSGCDISCLTFFGRRSAFFDDVKFGDFRARNDLVYFYRYLQCHGPCYYTGKVLAVYNIGVNTISSNKLKLVKFQYLVSREVGGLSLISSIFNVLRWIVYGLKKYR
jgi:teichuronic acid biosynthesis glycosyltransferase TuaG